MKKIFFIEFKKNIWINSDISFICELINLKYGDSKIDY